MGEPKNVVMGSILRYLPLAFQLPDVHAFYNPFSFEWVASVNMMVS
jgi:hypothetical protein